MMLMFIARSPKHVTHVTSVEPWREHWREPACYAPAILTDNLMPTHTPGTRVCKRCLQLVRDLAIAAGVR